MIICQTDAHFTNFMNKDDMTSTQNKSTKRIIIHGVTDAGHQFRPTDWAERVSGSLCTFRNRRIVYSPMLQPLYKNGAKCVAIEPELIERYPDLFQSLMDFAKVNHLIVSEEDEEP